MRDEDGAGWQRMKKTKTMNEGRKKGDAFDLDNSIDAHVCIGHVEGLHV